MSSADSTRRDFLKAGSAAVAAVAVGGCSTTEERTRIEPGPATTLNYNPKMGYRRLGKTNLLISEISLGGHGTPHDLPEAEQIDNRRRVLAAAAECGMNYLDTNIVGECALYGKALGKDRDKWHIGFASWPEKLTPDGEPDLSPESLTREIEGRLTHYQTDCLDIWRPVGATWGPGQTKRETMHEISPRVLDMVVEVFEKVRQQGKVRFLGVSAHNPVNFQRVLNEYPQFSVILFPRLFLEEELGGDSLLELAKARDVGVIGLKPFAAGATFGIKPRDISGQADQRAASLLKLMLADARVSAIIPGVNSADQIGINVRASHERDIPVTAADRQALRSCMQSIRDHLTPEYQWLHRWRYV